MTSATKIMLAVIGLLVGVLIVYYGFVLPGGGPPDGSDPVVDPLASSLVLDEGVEPAEVVTRANEKRPTQTPGTQAPRTMLTVPVTMGEPNPALPRNEQAAAPVRPMTGADVSAGRDRPNRSGLEPGVASDRGGGKEGATPRVTAPAVEKEVTRTREPRLPEKPAETRPPKAGTYVVKPDDTLSSIAQAWYGDHRKWRLIADANGVNPEDLQIGHTLRLPAVTATPPGSRTPGSYTVTQGDTLTSISKSVYGTTRSWRRLFDANRRVIGANPDDLRSGIVLTIPR